MKLKIIVSILLIGVLSATAFAATRASLSSQVVLSANTFSTGTVDLQISNTQSATSPQFHDTSVNGFSGTVLPGQTISKLFWLKDNSSDVDFAIAAQAASISGEIVPADVTVAFTPVSNDGLTNTGSTVSATLSDWESVLSLGSTIANSVKQRYKMEVSLSSSISTTGSINFDFVFTGTQTP